MAGEVPRPKAQRPKAQRPKAHRPALDAAKAAGGRDSRLAEPPNPAGGEIDRGHGGDSPGHSVLLGHREDRLLSLGCETSHCGRHRVC